MLLPAGTRLGTYEISALLGAGGMGEVYRARDVRLGREVAVKVLPPDVASSPDRQRRFEREARTVAGLNHPNIVTLFSVEEERGVRFLTMELVDGQTLSAFVTPGGLPLAGLLDIAIPLTDALVAAHERGVIHRDLKPGNVMVTRDARVKVLDFGLAKMIEADAFPAEATIGPTAAAPVSGEGQLLGTVPYMAPEQLRGEPADARSDLFALGVILYELATGHRPFNGRTPADVSSSILRDSPDPLRRSRSDLPDDLERIVSQCLEKNPRERLQTALDVNNALRRLRKEIDRGEPAGSDSRKVASIAVLPFINRSRDPDDEYFSDGLADELLNVLGKIKGLRVTARTSSFSFKGKDATILDVGKALDVATVLEGSVRKAGNRVRISVQLVKVSDSSQLWSETYDRTLEDVFAVQDDIAQSVVRELRTALLGEEPRSDASGQARAEVAKAGQGRTNNPEAHRLYLLGRHLVDRRSREQTMKGIEYLKQAVELDPEFVLALTEMGRGYSMAAGLGWAPLEEAGRAARDAVERALRLAPDLADGYARLGAIRMFSDWDFRAAQTLSTRALELEPRNVNALLQAGALASTFARNEEAIGFFQRALEQDPLSAPNYRNLGLSLRALGRFREAEAVYQKALELAPQSAGTRAALSMTLLALQRYEEAMIEAAREPEEFWRLCALAMLHATLGNRSESDAALQAMIDKYGDLAGFQIAEVYGSRGETDSAFGWLERAYAKRDYGLIGVKASTFLRSLHADPRWAPFLGKMGLEA